ncbi:hypothetical protein [Cupriavidus sp. USMAA2-4]|uniref:hypothetical protein n=1 Tax=Cupriavidus sp. USMAA2-4 TaxID=876364 RepID=UPI0012F4F1F1|nr:hypothetical protein [Cupriavidus sp. USMAA2-4]
MTYTHTPGPWKYAGSDSAGAGGLLIGPSGEPVAVVYGASTNPCSESNGRLLEAAPDLLQAAQLALRFMLSAGHRQGDVPLVLRDAIAKANGSKA